jgi:peroxiredoxin Q/BCP
MDELGATEVPHPVARLFRMTRFGRAGCARFTMPRVVLAPGDPAPDFTLPGSDGRTYRLTDFAGHEAVVVAWFPKAFTGG